MSPVPAAAVLAALAVAAWRAPAQRRWPYLIGTLSTGLTVFLITPFVEVIGTHVLWTGPTIPVVGTLDIRTEELRNGLFQGLRVTAVGLAFAVYALLLDHDRLLAAAGWARRSTLAVALATRLVPVLERDARELRLALRGRQVELGPVRLLSPLLAGSLERGLNLAEAMEARGYGRAGGTRAPRSPWRVRDRVALAAVPVIVALGALWL